MSFKLPEKYAKENLVDRYSAAYIFYMFSGANDDLTSMVDLGTQKRRETDDEKEVNAEIEKLDTADGFFKWMKKVIAPGSREVLNTKMLEHEDEAAPMVKKRILTTRLDTFVESATRFFVSCKDDPTDWIMENYKDIVDPYAKSMMCLALGFRGDERCGDFLLGQAEALKGAVADGKMEQGPIIALYMIAGKDEFLK